MTLSKIEQALRAYRQTKLVTVKPIETNEPLENIFVLPQMRKTFHEESIISLADNIDILGLFNAVILNNKTKNVNKNMIAGERRLRALQFLKINPDRYVKDVLEAFFEQYKVATQSRNAKLALSKYKQTHLKKYSTIRSLVFKNLNQEQLNAIQFAENTYEPVDPVETAEACERSYLYMKDKYEKRGKTLTMKLFASSIGKSTSSIRDALKFTRLPEEIRKLVKEGVYEPRLGQVFKLQYGVAVQLNNFEKSEDRKEFAHRAMLNKWNDEEMRNALRAIDTKSKGSQTSFLEEVVASERRNNIINEVGTKMFYATITQAKYLERLLTLANEVGALDPLRLKSVEHFLGKLGLVSTAMCEHAKKKRNKIESKYTGPVLKVVYPSGK